MSDFAKRLRKYRKQKKITQVELAKQLHYGYTAIANYESGRNEPSIDDLISIAEILDVTLEELVGIEMKAEELKFLSAFKKLDTKKTAIGFKFD